jgi:hypothetical protein
MSLTGIFRMSGAEAACRLVIRREKARRKIRRFIGNNSIDAPDQGVEPRKQEMPGNHSRFAGLRAWRFSDALATVDEVLVHFFSPSFRGGREGCAVRGKLGAISRFES